MSKEAMKRLTRDDTEHGVEYYRADEVDALLAEQTAQQEPVAYAVYHRMGGGKSLHWPEQHSPDGDASQYQLLPLYTSSPPQRKPLTDEQFQAIKDNLFRQEGWDGESWDLTLKEAIEAAHGIKENT